MAHSLPSARPDLGTKAPAGTSTSSHKDYTNTGTSTSSKASTPPQCSITITVNDFPSPSNSPTSSNYASPPSSPSTSTTTTIEERPGTTSPEFSTGSYCSTPSLSSPATKYTSIPPRCYVSTQPSSRSIPSRRYPWLKKSEPRYDPRSAPRHHLPCLQCKALDIKCSFTANRQRKPQWLGWSHCSRCWREGEPVCLKEPDESEAENESFWGGGEVGKAVGAVESKGGVEGDVDVDELARQLRDEKWWKREWEDWALPRDDPKGRRRRVTDKVRKRWGRFDFGLGMEGKEEGAEDAWCAQTEMLKWIGVDADVGLEE